MYLILLYGAQYRLSATLRRNVLRQSGAKLSRTDLAKHSFINPASFLKLRESDMCRIMTVSINIDVWATKTICIYHKWKEDKIINHAHCFM